MNLALIRDLLISFILAGGLMFLLKLPLVLALVLGATFFFSIRATHKFHARTEAEKKGEPNKQGGSKP